MNSIIDFEYSFLYEFIRQGFAIIFYILLAIYVFYKIYNTIIIRKVNCKKEYQKTKKEILNQFNTFLRLN